MGGLIHFSVMIGEVLSLGALSVTESFLKTFGLSRFDHILRKASSALVSSTRGLVSDSYRFGRFWKDKTYALEGLEEIARRIDPNHWQHLILLPFWTIRSSRSGSPDVLDFIRERTDLLFYDPEKELGCILLRRTSPIAPHEAGFHGGHDSHGVFD